MYVRASAIVVGERKWEDTTQFKKRKRRRTHRSNTLKHRIELQENYNIVFKTVFQVGTILIIIGKFTVAFNHILIFGQLNF